MYTPRTQRPRRGRPQPRYGWWITAAATFLVLVSLLSGAPSARAAEYPAGDWGTWNGASTHWGTMVVAGQYGYCVDPGLTPPARLDPARATRVCGDATADGDPDPTSQLAYLLARYATTSNNAIAASVSQFARAQYHAAIPVTHPATYDQLVAEARHNGGPRSAYVQVDADAHTISYGLVRAGETAESAHFATGFAATLTITTPNATFPGGAPTVTVTTGEQAQAVPFVPRHPLTAGEVVMVSLTVADVPEPCYLLYVEGPLQRVAVALTTTITGEGRGAATQTLWQPRISTQLDRAAPSADIATVTDTVQVDAVNDTQWPVLTWGDADQTIPATYAPLVASGTLARAATPLAASRTLPSSAHPLPGAPFLATLAGPGQATSVQVPVPADRGAGYYAVQWCLDPARQTSNPTYLPPGPVVCDDWYAPTERFVLPMRLAVSSTAPQQYRAVGEPPDDTVTISLADPADQWLASSDGSPTTVTLDGTYYGGSSSTFAASNSVPPDARAVGATTVDVTLPVGGRDPVTVTVPAGFTVPTSQYGAWVWTLDLGRQSPTAQSVIAASVSDTFGQPAETIATTMSVAIVSRVVSDRVSEPVTTTDVCDRVWVELPTAEDRWLNQWGTNQPVEVTVTGGLYHAAVPGPVTVDPGDVPVVDQRTLTFTAAGEDRAQTMCHTVGPGDYGAYGFVYTLTRDDQPAATQDLIASDTVTPLWLPEETTLVTRQPVIRTSASRWDTTGNGVTTTYVSDAIWQVGWPDGPEDTDVYGAVQHGDWPGYGPWVADARTITVELWRIVGPVTPQSCATDNPSASLVATNTVIAAANTWSAARTVSGSRFAATGGDATYTFVVSSPGDARTDPFRSICGEPSETIAVVGAPTVAASPAGPSITTRAPAHATVGDTVHDEALVTGPYPAGTIIEFWGRRAAYVDTTAPTDQLRCPEPDPNDLTGATRIGTVTLDAAVADGEVITVSSPDFTATTPGCTFIKEMAIAPGSGGATLAAGWFGQPNETTLWLAAPPLLVTTGGAVWVPPSTGAGFAWAVALIVVLATGGGAVAYRVIRERQVRASS